MTSARLIVCLKTHVHVFFDSIFFGATLSIAIAATGRNGSGRMALPEWWKPGISVAEVFIIDLTPSGNEPYSAKKNLPSVSEIPSA